MNISRKHSSAISCDLERFVNAQNISRYRRLLDPATDEGRRRVIFKLLKNEMVKLRER